jgi:hypothetical protein
MKKPKTKRKSRRNVDGIIILSGSRIGRNAAGFQFETEDKIIGELKWNQVSTIFGSTRICDQVAKLCLGFSVEDDEKWTVQMVFVEDGLLSNDVLLEIFPGFDKDWAAKVAFDEAAELADLAPHYYANITEIWRRVVKSAPD